MPDNRPCLKCDTCGLIVPVISVSDMRRRIQLGQICPDHPHCPGTLVDVGTVDVGKTKNLESK